eukprot:656961-Prorocentrum_minimum.AAC.5
MLPCSFKLTSYLEKLPLLKKGCTTQDGLTVNDEHGPSVQTPQLHLSFGHLGLHRHEREKCADDGEILHTTCMGVLTSGEPASATFQKSCMMGVTANKKVICAQAHALAPLS